MSTVKRIGQLTSRIFNNTLTEKAVRRNANSPIKVSNFQKNILMEDFFESTNKKIENNHKSILHEDISVSTKRMYAALVGSITDFGNRLHDGIEAIGAFGSRVKNSIVGVWNKIYEVGNTEVTIAGVRKLLGRDINSLFGNTHEREISKLAKLDPKSEIAPMFKESLSALEYSVAA